MLHEDTWDHYPYKGFRTYIYWKQEEGENSTFARIRIFERVSETELIDEVFTSKSAARKHLELITIEELEDEL